MMLKVTFMIGGIKKHCESTNKEQNVLRTVTTKYRLQDLRFSHLFPFFNYTRVVPQVIHCALV